MTAQVLMYGTTSCPYCKMAERLLEVRGVTNIKKILIDNDDRLKAEMIEKTGKRTVPQIFIGNTYVGGFDNLAALDKAGKLLPLLQSA